MTDDLEMDRRGFLTLLMFLLLFTTTLPTEAKPRRRKQEPKRVISDWWDVSLVYSPPPHLSWMSFGNYDAFTITPGAWLDLYAEQGNQRLVCQTESVEHVGNDSWGSDEFELWNVGFRVHHILDDDALKLPEDLRRALKRQDPGRWRERKDWERAHAAKIGDLWYGRVNLTLANAANQRRRMAAGECGRCRRK